MHGPGHHPSAGQLATRSDGAVDDASEINSGHLAVGESYEYRFDQPGVYAYTCIVDPVHTALMHGTITVLPTGN